MTDLNVSVETKRQSSNCAGLQLLDLLISDRDSQVKFPTLGRFTACDWNVGRLHHCQNHLSSSSNTKKVGNITLRSPG